LLDGVIRWGKGRWKLKKCKCSKGEGTAESAAVALGKSIVKGCIFIRIGGSGSP